MGYFAACVAQSISYPKPREELISMRNHGTEELVSVPLFPHHPVPRSQTYSDIPEILYGALRMLYRLLRGYVLR